MKINGPTLLSSFSMETSTKNYEEAHRAIFSNITDTYIKIQKNRADIDKKCPRSKCDKILKKVKKVKSSVEFIQKTNITVLETLVDMLKNSSSAELLTKLEPIENCMKDPTVSAKYCSCCLHSLTPFRRAPAQPLTEAPLIFPLFWLLSVTQPLVTPSQQTWPHSPQM